MAETATKPKRTRKKGAKTIAREYFEAVGRRDLDAMTSFYKPGGRGRIHGAVELEVPGTYRQWFGNLFRAFPDFEFEILDIAASGDRAAVRWRARATFSGEAKFEGLAPNGARVDIEGCDMLSIEDGKIVENNAYTNWAQLGQQLGVLPPQGSFGEKAVTGLVNARTAATDAVRRFRERS
jgi:predicted ester cyclase